MIDKLKYPIFRMILLMVILIFISPLSIDATDDYEIVTPINVNQIIQLDRLGHGVATQLDWHPNGKIIAFGGGWGVWLLDEQFDEVAHFTNIPKTQDIAWHPTENVLATLHEDKINLWKIDDNFSTSTLIRTLSVNPPMVAYGRNLERCMVWSADGQMIGLATPPSFNRIYDLGEWGDESRPRDAQQIELYNSTNGELLSTHDDELEHRLNVRCRYGTVSPDGELQTYLQYGTGRRAGISLFVTPDFDAEPIAERELALADIYATAWHPSGGYITMLHGNSILNLTWEELERTSFKFFNGYIDTLDWSATSDYLLANNKHAPAVYLWHRSDSAQSVFDQIPVALSGDGIESGGIWWGSTEDTLLAYTGEYGYERYDFIAVATGERTRSISRVWGVTRGTFGEDVSPHWNGDFTGYALFDWRSNEIIFAGFDGEPENIIWNSELARYVIDDDTDAKETLPEIKYPIELQDILGMTWQEELLRIATGESWSSANYYLLNPDTGELSETAAPKPSIVVADWSRRDIRDDEGTVDYDLTIRHPITGETLAMYSEAEHPYAPIGEGGWSVSAYAVNPTQSLVAIAVKGGVAFYSLTDGALLYTVYTESDIGSLDWDPVGEILAVGSMDGTVYLLGVARS